MEYTAQYAHYSRCMILVYTWFDVAYTVQWGREEQ